MQNEKAKELKDGLAKRIEALASDTDAARQSELFTAYLRTCGTFHNYSWHNCGLIWSQKPEATRVAGFQTWKKTRPLRARGFEGNRDFCAHDFQGQERSRR
jgi:hypothetical protein